MDPRMNIHDAIGQMNHILEIRGPEIPAQVHRPGAILNEIIRGNNDPGPPRNEPQRPAARMVSGAPGNYRSIQCWCTSALQKKLKDNLPAVQDDRPDDRPVSACELATRMVWEFEQSIDPDVHPDEKKVQLVRHLIDVVEIDVNWADTCGRTCLYYAVQQQNHELAKFLLDAGAKIDTCDSPRDQRRIGGIHPIDAHIFGSLPIRMRPQNNVLYLSLQLGDRKMIRLLIEAKAKITDIELATAVLENDLNAVRLAVEFGFDVNFLMGETPGRNCTLVHMAVYYSKPDILNYLLLELNANFNICDSLERTPLKCAIEAGPRAGRERCVEILLAHHNNLPRQRGSSLLGKAISKNSTGIVDLLLRHIAILQSQGPFVDPDTYTEIEKNTNARDYLNVCEFELERMKKSPVSDAITFYDVLVETDLGPLLKDRSIFEILEDYNFEESFSIYGRLIRMRLEIKRKRVEFENRVIAGMGRILGLNLSSNHLIRNEILQYLKRSDMLALSII